MNTVTERYYAHTHGGSNKSYVEQIRAREQDGWRVKLIVPVLAGRMSTTTTEYILVTYEVPEGTPND